LTSGVFFAPVADKIISRVATHFNVRPSQITSARRHRTLATARWVCMYLMRLAGGSSTQIGVFLGDRDHSTVLSGLKKLGVLADKYPDVRETLDRLAGLGSPSARTMVAAGAGL
jgi:chromosomal replication initiator protein